MKAEEMRIGNLVYHDWDTPILKKMKLVEVTATFSHIITVKYKNKVTDGIRLTQIKPIQLTDEWLIKFGFKKVNNLLTFGNFEIGVDADDFLNQKKTVRFKRSIYIKIKYVHQLQNLYFVLEGKELNYEN